ncbi:MAG TPA: hypothetical protein VHL31_01620 [Geminicoccus sp.]|uniref:hypothetical protein n=1 Tax=Geminicoccus sp. TaxID=2024832 RepID=UPI002E32393A|nr:hypothetical protein [Geminicoccus sp.]HEX2524985.1 hypothetical protein [Geminicoccus sp.]
MANTRVLNSNDIDIAEFYFPILVQCAKNRTKITYGKLVETAQRQPSAPAFVNGETAVGTGRRLYALRLLTVAAHLPDLSPLVVQQDTDHPGEGLIKVLGKNPDLDPIFDYDWSHVVSLSHQAKFF